MWIFKLLMNMYTQDYRLQFRKTLCLFSPQERFIEIQSHWGSQLQVQIPVIPKIQLLKTMRNIQQHLQAYATEQQERLLIISGQNINLLKKTKSAYGEP